MFGLDIRTTWIVIAWLIPLWWATSLLVLACLANLSPAWRALAWRVFIRLGNTPPPP